MRLILSLLLAASAFAQSPAPSAFKKNPEIYFSASVPAAPVASISVLHPVGTAPAVLQFRDPSGKLVLSIGTDGKIVMGDGITPDEAAKQFFAAIQKDAPSLKCGEAK